MDKWLWGLTGNRMMRLTIDLAGLTPLEALGDLHAMYREGRSVDIEVVMHHLDRLFQEV